MADEEKKREESKQKEREELGVLTLLRSVHNNLKRIETVGDPATKACMLVDKLAYTVDAGMAVLDIMLPQWCESKELKQEAKEVSELLKQQLDGLFMWVQNPQYGPNHPLGHQMMQNAGNDFQNLARNNNAL